MTNSHCPYCSSTHTIKFITHTLNVKIKCLSCHRLFFEVSNEKQLKHKCQRSKHKEDNHICLCGE